MSAINVRVIRPRFTAAKFVEFLFVGVGTVALGGWLVMLLAPLTPLPISVGYAEATATMAVLRILLPSGSYLNWTYEAGKS